MNAVVTGILASGVFAGIVSIVLCIFMIVFRKPIARDAGASRNLAIVRSPPCARVRGGERSAFARWSAPKTGGCADGHEVL